jgi:hypothetical protein
VSKPLLFIDSGAYSASTKGVKIDIRAYAAFLKQWARYIDVAACLDVLFNPEASWGNQKALEALGCAPIPTFHFGEPMVWLERYIDQYPYIALGGAVGQPPAMLIQWLDELWGNYLTDSDGFPVVKVHGFGITGVPLMVRYPWFSVDSTSWLMAAANGKAAVYRPDPYTGEHNIEMLALSEKSPFKGQRNAHVDSMTDANRQGVLDLVATSGFDFALLQSDYKERFYCNAHAFSTMAAHCKLKPFHKLSTGLFDKPKHSTKKCLPPWDALTLYIAGNTGVTGITRELMRRGYNRLLSYHYIKQTQSNFNEAKEILNAYLKD